MDGFFHQSLRWYIPASLQIYFRSAFPSLFFFFLSTPCTRVFPSVD